MAGVDRSNDTRGAGSRAPNSGGGGKGKKGALPTSVVTERGRMAFGAIWEPKLNEQSGQTKYEVTLLFPPGTDMTGIETALENAAVNKFGPREDWPRSMRKPSDVIGYCEDKDYVGYVKGWRYVKFSSNDQPGVTDNRVQPVLERREVYNGRWARVSANAYGYDNVSKGVAFGLNNIQILQNDESFSGRKRAEDEFSAVKYDDEDHNGADRRESRDRGRDRDPDNRDGDRDRRESRGRDDNNRERGRDDRDRDRDARPSNTGRGTARDESRSDDNDRWE